MRVLVCGGRNYDKWLRLSEVLWQLADERHWWEARDHGTLVIITGGAKGADTHAYQWADMHQFKQEIYPALWNIYSGGAGPIRNQQMLETGIDLVVAFPGGRGTADMVRRARKAGVEVIEVKHENAD